jgi:hypothetical protein
MLPRSFSLHGFLFAVVVCLALPALAIGIDTDTVGLPPVTPESVGFVAFLYVFREIHLRQSKLLELTIRQLADPGSQEDKE